MFKNCFRRYIICVSCEWDSVKLFTSYGLNAMNWLLQRLSHSTPNALKGWLLVVVIPIPAHTALKCPHNNNTAEYRLCADYICSINYHVPECFSNYYHVHFHPQWHKLFCVSVFLRHRHKPYYTANAHVEVTCRINGNITKVLARRTVRWMLFLFRFAIHWHTISTPFAGGIFSLSLQYAAQRVSDFLLQFFSSHLRLYGGWCAYIGCVKVLDR